MFRKLLTGLVAVLLLGPLAFEVAPGRTDPETNAPAAGFELPRMSLASAAIAQEHGLLIDVHSAAGLSCTTCHGEAAFTEPVATETCTTCHGTYAELAELTPWEPNPHRSHMGELACSTCHNIHRPSVSFCDDCHSFGMQVP